jgi:hypothetical protein
MAGADIGQVAFHKRMHEYRARRGAAGPAAKPDEREVF